MCGYAWMGPGPSQLFSVFPLFFVVVMATLEPVLVRPAMSLQEMKDVAKELYGSQLATRQAEYDCLEIFGQSASLRSGFQRAGLKCQSFDVRC